MIQVWRTSLPVAPASGEETAFSFGPPEAAELFDAGSRAYTAGRYGEALQAWDGAYDVSPLPQLRCHQAACLDRLGLPELAAQRYEAYLAEAPDAADAHAVRAQAEILHEQAREAAQAASERGHAAAAQGLWREAAWAHAQAHEQLPLPAFLLDQADALERAGDRPRAARCLQQVLDAHPERPDAPALRARIDALAGASRNRPPSGA